VRFCHGEPPFIKNRDTARFSNHEEQLANEEDRS